MDPAIVNAPDNLFTVLERMGQTGLAAEIRQQLSP